jgi:hypothetical protein
MIKTIAAAAVLSLLACSATGAGAVPSTGGLNDPAASESVQVKRGEHARSEARWRGEARGDGDFRRGRVARARGDYRRHGYGGDGWGRDYCTSSWVLLCH